MTMAKASFVGRHDFIGLRSFSWLFVVVFLGSNIFTVVRAKGVRIISEEEDLEIERQLKALNKPAVKTIHTEWGDILDCVDINRQPGLDHPSLKHHKVQIKPSFPYKRLKPKTSSTAQHKHSLFRPLNDECPEGTVPIRRTTKEDLIRAKSLSKSDARTPFNESKASTFPGETLVGLTLGVTGETYYGASGNISIYGPSMYFSQSSSAEIAIESGANEGTNGIRFGWTAFPKLYGDIFPRLFGRWTADGYRKTGCYNNHCPGWIQTSSTIYLGQPFRPISKYGGDQYYHFFLVYQEEVSKNWWLVVEDIEHVGYWTNQVFTSLNSGATRIFWGGHVTPSPNGTSPEMGSGHKPYWKMRNFDLDHSSTFIDIRYDTTGTLLSPSEGNVVEIRECSKDNYDLYDYGIVKGKEFTFVYGGPGGSCP